jgi:hypothetical protein
MKSSPLAQVKDRFKDKESLVSALRALATEQLWIGRIDEGKGLDCVSNKKLLRLHDVLSEVQKTYGGRTGAIDAILKAEKREKDTGYRARLEGQPTPRLLDHANAATRTAKKAAAKH